MEDNPFMAFAGLIGSGEAPPNPFCSGIVKTAEPLSIQALGLLLEHGELRVNAALLPETDAYSVQITGGTLQIGTASGAASGTITADVKREKGALKPGDQVLLLRESDNLFDVLCKVVDNP